MLGPREVLIDMVFTQGREICSTAALSLCWRHITTRAFSHSHDHSMCKSGLTPLFMLLIVLYNSVYYNYIIIMQKVGWLVLGSRQKGGLRRHKSALWPRDIYPKAFTNDTVTLECFHELAGLLVLLDSITELPQSKSLN